MTRRWLGRLTIVAAVCAGAALGVGGYTFGYAGGLSYFSADPRACANCHIMNPEYDSWIKSSHHIVARCADCHLPHALVPKLIAKAENGWHHSKGFTLQDFAEPIMIKEKNARILQEACLGCHGELVHGIVSGSTTDQGAVRCVHCHRSVGHGPIH
ncbi:MAG: cytochrome c nitrite reductase small subunit [Minicystis sp.]